MLLAIEFSPVAEEICKISRSFSEGYKEWNPSSGDLNFLDVASHDTKIRPEACCFYAAGKATNVARVLAGLSNFYESKDDHSIGLKTVLPDGQGDSFHAARAMNEMIKLLQSGSMRNVDLSFETVRFQDPSGKVRKALHVIDKQTHSDLINFTPKLRWSINDMQNAIDKINLESRPSWIILAGSPPAGAEALYGGLIAKIREQQPEQRISLDASGSALQYCLEDRSLHPKIISINRDEYFSVDFPLWKEFKNTLLVHDKQGCWIVTEGGNRLRENWQSIPYFDIRIFEDRFNAKIGPTLGAGDAFHAGALFAFQVLTYDAFDAVRFGLAVASVAVRTGAGISQIDYREIGEAASSYKTIPMTHRNPA